jgi:hypothetical protein
MTIPNRYEGRGHGGRRFIAYAPTQRGALAKLRPHGVWRVRQLPALIDERQGEVVDVRKAPGS